MNHEGTQRFLSLDPIEFLSGDFNFYRYVGNEPVNFTDPSGTFLPLLYIVGSIAVRAAIPLVLRAAAPAVGRAVAVGAGGRVVLTEAEKRAALLAARTATNINTEVKVAGTEGDVECGNKGLFKDQKNPAKNGLERDHIPSQASVLKRAADDLGLKRVSELGTCIKNRLKNWAETLALPKDFHKQGRTNGNKNTQEQIELDSEDLGDAVDKDVEAYEDQLDDADIPEECKEKIKEALEEIKEKTDDELTDFIDDQIQHCIDAGKFTL
ncbi:RHS repeat-associated core domain-containing protein [Poseidonibacter sp. 1_MG-2023]|uniref:RHS repeat-associated core domain-containing protein n=1 Tax=Poseidonibacter TaxID=2321187 RepID=UPI001E5644BD|nr:MULTISPECIES: RHS repeat-associated core domain-containing protein [Poseidonibacter]MDO6826577.1 RHS repeat-associated core domain-containing protein [Poseidonibacter sp. 1_MG-2023]